MKNYLVRKVTDLLVRREPKLLEHYEPAEIAKRAGQELKALVTELPKLMLSEKGPR